MASLSGKTVLVVDDAEDVRILVRKILESDGAQVFDAASVDQATELARTRAPHLLVTDLGLPEKSGFDLLQEWSSDPVLRAIPALVLSGKTDRQSVVQAINLGASDFVLKPFRAAFLLQKARKALRVGSFLARKLAGEEALDATCFVSAEISRISEVGCLVETVVKLPPEVTVALSSPVLDELGVSQVMLRTLDRPLARASEGRYIAELNFIGIGQEQALRIRARLTKHK